MAYELQEKCCRCKLFHNPVHTNTCFHCDGENSLPPETNFVCGDFVVRKGLCPYCEGLEGLFRQLCPGSANPVWEICPKCKGTGKTK